MSENNPFGQSFDAIAQAIQQKNAGTNVKAPVTEAPVTEAPVTEAPVTEAPVTEAPVAKMSFEELVAQARVTAAQKGTSINPAPTFTPAPMEVPVVEETTAPVVEETTAPVVEETTAPVVEETTAPVVEETTAPEIIVTDALPFPDETPVVETPVVEDNTEDYRVDVLTNEADTLATADSETMPTMEATTPVVESSEVVESAPVKKPRRKAKPKADATPVEAPVESAIEASVETPSNTPSEIIERVENVFGKEEVQEMRTLLRAWMRHEMKLAMVEAVKDIARDFNV